MNCTENDRPGVIAGPAQCHKSNSQIRHFAALHTVSASFERGKMPRLRCLLSRLEINRLS
jgi:hypothetical protein